MDPPNEDLARVDELDIRIVFPKCPDCGIEVAFEMQSCPRCGRKEPGQLDPARAEFKSQAAALLLFLVVAALAVLLVMLLP